MRGNSGGTLLVMQPGMTDARRHRLCLLLALAGSLLMGAVTLSNIRQAHAVYDLPTFEASKPPLSDVPRPPRKGPRV
jgi:hypothetical protein